MSRHDLVSRRISCSINWLVNAQHTVSGRLGADLKPLTWSTVREAMEILDPAQRRPALQRPPAHRCFDVREILEFLYLRWKVRLNMRKMMWTTQRKSKIYSQAGLTGICSPSDIATLWQKISKNIWRTDNVAGCEFYNYVETHNFHWHELEYETTAAIELRSTITLAETRLTNYRRH